MTSPNNSPIALLDFPIELLHAALSFLATDSLIDFGLTCHAARQIVAKLHLWSHHDLHLDQKLFSTPEVYQSVIRRAVAVPPRLVFGGDASAYISGVVSITLNHESLLPVSAALVVRILDNFTSLREASFVGCLQSGKEFFALASQDRRGSLWASRGLRRLDLSDSEFHAKRAAKGPLFRGDFPGDPAWESEVFYGEATLVRKFQLLVDAKSSLKAYPSVCRKCKDEPSYSWSPANQCVYCNDWEQCLKCGNCLWQYWNGDDSRGTWCEANCGVFAKLCYECRPEVGWGNCKFDQCWGECCPNCVKPCNVCGDVSAMCFEHGAKCECSHLCLTCLERARCELCGELMNVDGHSSDGNGCQTHTCPYCHLGEVLSE